MVRTLTDALREFTDERLLELLAARKDLTSPTPLGISPLAARASASASVHRALASLRRPELQLAEALVAHEEPLTPEELAHAVSSSTEAIAPHVLRLTTLALVFTDEEHRHLVPVRALSEAIPHPAGLGPRLSSDPTARQASALISALPPQLADVAASLAWGPARLTGDPASPLARALVEAGLAVKLDGAQGPRLLIPRTVHLALRGGVVHREFAKVPVPSTAALPERFAGSRDAQGLEAALEVVRVAGTVDSWHADPPSVLKRGGLPVRDIRRLATAAATTPETWKTAIHAAWVAGLIGHDGETWQATRDASGWSDLPLPERWADLALAWSRCNYLGSVAGSRPLGEGAGADASDAARAALSPSVGRPGVKVRRKHMLRLMADLDGVSASEHDLESSLAWAFPTVPAPHRAEEAGAFITEARALGLVVDGAATRLGKAAAASLGNDAAEALAHLTSALGDLVPEPVDQVILDADLTLVVPGLPSAAVARALEWTQIESRGAGVQARFTPESVRRGIDAGGSVTTLLAQLADLSLTGVPQPLEYMLHDEARRHAQVTVGTSRAFITGEAEHLDTLMASKDAAALGLVRIAPEVIITDAEPSFVMRQVRFAGLAPLVRQADGSIAPEPSESSLRGGPLPLEVESDLSEEQLDVTPEEALARIRGGDAGTLEALSVTQRLLAALAEGQTLQMGIVDGRGGMHVTRAVPVSLEGGRMRALEEGGGEFTVLIHRVTLP